MNIKSTEWQTAYRTYFGAITSDTAMLWESAIKDNIPGTETKDIDHALATMAATWDFNEQRQKPSVRDIMRAIYKLKGYGRINFKDESEKIQAGIRLLKRVVAGDHSSMREVICCASDAWGLDPKAAEQMWTLNISHALEAYAVAHLGYKPDLVLMPDYRKTIEDVAEAFDRAKNLFRKPTPDAVIEPSCPRNPQSRVLMPPKAV